jgi:hypothetical protein
MGQIQGSLQNIEIDVANGTSFKNLVCLRTGSVNTTLDTTTDQTNCGVLTAVGEPSMTIDFDAVCEVSPSGTQVSYKDLLTASVNKTVIAVRVQNPTVSGSSTGASYYHQFSGYVTDLSLNQSTAEFMNFSGTIASSGTLDIVP